MKLEHSVQVASIKPFITNVQRIDSSMISNAIEDDIRSVRDSSNKCI